MLSYWKKELGRVWGVERCIDMEFWEIPEDKTYHNPRDVEFAVAMNQCKQALNWERKIATSRIQSE